MFSALPQLSILYPCRCGNPSIPVTLDYIDPETFESKQVPGRACPECVDDLKALFKKVKPVFHAMLMAGISRDDANVIMTFLMHRVAPIPNQKPPPPEFDFTQ